MTGCFSGGGHGLHLCRHLGSTLLTYPWQLLPLIATNHRYYPDVTVSAAKCLLFGSFEVESDPPKGWKGCESGLHYQCHCMNQSSYRCLWHSVLNQHWYKSEEEKVCIPFFSWIGSSPRGSGFLEMAEFVVTMLKCWTGLDGTLCKHLFYEHCSAVLIKHISPKDFFYPSDWFTESNNCDIIAYILIYPNSIGVCRLDTCFRASNSVAREGLVDSILVAEETKHLELFFVQTQFLFNLSG